MNTVEAKLIEVHFQGELYYQWVLYRPGQKFEGRYFKDLAEQESEKQKFYEDNIKWATEMHHRLVTDFQKALNTNKP